MSFLTKFKSGIGVEEESLEELVAPAADKSGDASLKKIAVKDKKKPSPQKAPEPKEPMDEERWFDPEGELAVDVYQTENEIVIQSTIAGLNGDDLDVSIENDVVTIYGERKNPADKNAEFLTQECYWGSFSRQVILPEEVDVNGAEALMKDGIFTLRLPKFQQQKAKKIKVRG